MTVTVPKKDILIVLPYLGIHSNEVTKRLKSSDKNVKRLTKTSDILASGKTDFHCKIKETLLIQELKPSLNVNVSSEKLLLY